MKCPKCEKENTNNSNVCEYCGSEMFDAVDTNPVEKQDEAPKKKSKKKVIIAVVAVIVAIALAVTGVFYILNEKEKQRQQDAKTGVTISDFSNKVEKLSVSENDDGEIGTYSDNNTKYTILADEYGNARKITLNCEVNMSENSQSYERLVSLSSYEIYNDYVAGYGSDLTLNKMYVDGIVIDGTGVYCLIADIDTKDNTAYMQAIDYVLALQSGKKVVNNWEMTLTYTNDYLRFEAIYVG